MMKLRFDVDISNWDSKPSGTTSKGNQAKLTDGNNWIKVNQFGYEDVAEAFVSDLLKCSTLDPSEYVEYNLCNLYSTTGNLTSRDGCISENFLGQDETLVTFARLLERNKIPVHEFTKGTISTSIKLESLIFYIQALTNIDTTDFLRKTLTLDMITLNEDRHLNNIALIYHPIYGYRPTPIFDNGLSMLSDTNAYPLERSVAENIQNVPCRPFHCTFQEMHDTLGEPAFYLYKDNVIQLLDVYSIGRLSSVIYHAMNLYPELFI